MDYTVLQCTLLHCATLYCTLHCAIIYYTTLQYTLLYCATMYCAALKWIVLSYNKLQWNIQQRTILHCAVSYATKWTYQISVTSSILKASQLIISSTSDIPKNFIKERVALPPVNFTNSSSAENRGTEVEKLRNNRDWLDRNRENKIKVCHDPISQSIWNCLSWCRSLTVRFTSCEVNE